MRQAVEDFAAALEGRGTVSTSDPALVPLLNLAQQLQAVPLAPTPAFRDSLRRRLVAVAAVTEPAAPVERPLDRARDVLEGWRVQRRLRQVAAAVATVVVLAGVSTVSTRSLPGDPLYRVKRTAENVQVQFARTEVNRGKRELQHAGTRLDELGRLVGAPSALGPTARMATAAPAGGDSDLVLQTLDDMDAATRRGVALLFEASQRTQSTAPLAVIQDFATRQQSQLAAVLPALPAVAQSRAGESMALLARIRTTTVAELGRLAACTPAGCPPMDISGCHCTPGDPGPATGPGSSGGSGTGPDAPPTGTPLAPDPGVPGPGGPGTGSTAAPGGAAGTLPTEGSDLEDLLHSLPPVPGPGPAQTSGPLPSLPPLPPPPPLPTPSLPALPVTTSAPTLP